MAKTIVKFELRGYDREIALALQRHVVQVEGLDMDLNTICRNQFLNWLRSKITEAQKEIDSGNTEAAQAETDSGRAGTDGESSGDSNQLQAGT